MRFSLFAIALVSFAACYNDNDPNLPPIDPRPPDWYPGDSEIVEVFPDDSPQAATSPCGKACANLKTLGCPEGKSKLCYRACVKQASIEKVPIVCWQSAKTQDAARACDRLRCLP